MRVRVLIQQQILQTAAEVTIISNRILNKLSPQPPVIRPVVLNTGVAAIRGIEDISRIKTCLFLCPLQGEEDRKKCRKDNCGKKDRSDNLDYYDGDFEGFDY